MAGEDLSRVFASLLSSLHSQRQRDNTVTNIDENILLGLSVVCPHNSLSRLSTLVRPLLHIRRHCDRRPGHPGPEQADRVRGRDVREEVRGGGGQLRPDPRPPPVRSVLLLSFLPVLGSQRSRPDLLQTPAGGPAGPGPGLCGHQLSGGLSCQLSPPGPRLTLRNVSCLSEQNVDQTSRSSHLGSLAASSYLPPNHPDTTHSLQSQDPLLYQPLPPQQ